MRKLKTEKVVWDLKDLFSSDNDPQMEQERKELEEKNYEFINKWSTRTDYLEDPKVLREALDELEILNRDLGSGGKQAYYLELRFSQEQDNPEIKAKIKKLEEFQTKIQNDRMFFSLKLGKVSEDKQKEFLSSSVLKEYKHFLEKVFKGAKYHLSESEEKVLNIMRPYSYDNWVRMLSGFLGKEEREVLNEKGKKELKSYSEIYSLLPDKNKKVRDSAAEALNDILIKNLDVAENEINTIFSVKAAEDRMRGFARPDEERHLHDDIESEVVDALVEAVSNRFELSNKYYELKAKLFGVKKLEYHERSVEYGTVEKKYSYDEAVNLVYKVFTGLDPQIAEIFAGFVENGYTDVFPRKGKRSGAACWHNLISQPTYIILNHSDKLNDVLTIAHEAGHGVNNELIKLKQHSLNFGTPTSTAEVASTFMEDFVLQEILKEADDELRLSLMMAKLNDDISSIVRQVACYKFETELHGAIAEKGYLSKEEIGKIFQKNMLKYMGDYVEASKGSENWWVCWPHVRYFFYVYSYASGLLISKSLQNSVKQDPKFIEKVKEFLSAGYSESPKNIFAKMGIDITDKNFWNKGLDEVEELLKETEELARKLGKIK